MTDQELAEFSSLCDQGRKVSREICRIMRLPPGHGDKAKVLPGLFAQHDEIAAKTKPYREKVIAELDAELSGGAS